MNKIKYKIENLFLKMKWNIEGLFSKYIKTSKKKKTSIPVVKIGIHRKSVIALWCVLIMSLVFAVYKNFTAIDTHTVHEEKIIELRLNDTNGVANFVRDFAKVYYSWENKRESIDARNEALTDYLTNELQQLNNEVVRADIPTSSKVTDVQIWKIKQVDEDYLVLFEVKQEIKESGKVKSVSADYSVKVHVDDKGDMVIIQNPTIAKHAGKSTYETQVTQSDNRIPVEKMDEITNFLETFFKLNPKVTATELSYYAVTGTLPCINKDYVYSKILNPVFTEDGKGIRVKVFVQYIDKETKALQISQYDMTLQKDSNWKIIAIH